MPGRTSNGDLAEDAALEETWVVSPNALKPTRSACLEATIITLERIDDFSRDFLGRHVLEIYQLIACTRG